MHVALIILNLMAQTSNPAEGAVFQILVVRNEQAGRTTSRRLEFTELRQTGFLVLYHGSPVVATALHGVVAAREGSIVARGPTQADPLRDLIIIAADPERDLALLSASDLDLSNCSPFSIGQARRSDVLDAIGYPEGIEAQWKRSNITIGAQFDEPSCGEPEVKLSRLLNDILIFQTRNSPSIDICVLGLDALLEPGFSGAPIVNSSNEVVGVCLGGTRGTPRSFAVAWSEAHFRPRTEVEKELDRLRPLKTEGLYVYSSPTRAERMSRLTPDEQEKASLLSESALDCLLRISVDLRTEIFESAVEVQNSCADLDDGELKRFLALRDDRYQIWYLTQGRAVREGLLSMSSNDRFVAFEEFANTEERAQFVLATNAGRSRMRECIIWNAVKARSISGLNCALDKFPAAATVRRDGMTPLHLAAYYNFPEGVRVLVNASANVDATRDCGDLGGSCFPYTALHYAALMNCPEVARILIASGADETVRVNGKTAIMIAIEMQHEEVLAVLTE